MFVSWNRQAFSRHQGNRLPNDEDRRMNSGVALHDLSLDSPEVIGNPYPVYRRLQLEDPVHWDPGLRAWIVTRYADVVAGLRDPSLSARPDLSSLDRPETAPLY